MTATRVLVIDDEPSICWGFQQWFGDAGHLVETAGTAEEGLQRAASHPPDVVLLDVRLPGISGLEALDQLQRLRPSLPVIVMTAFGDLETAVRAVQLGAFEYLTKPFELATAASAVSRALERSAQASTSPAIAPPSDGRLLGAAPVMQRVFKEIALAAASSLTVLIGGETGTGKELAAQAIHAHSARRKRPFIPVCLGALSPSVIESELFGHVKGAFTGAAEDRAGLIAQAEQGTLFLDEIGDTPAAVQVKLLRFLESGEYVPVGTNTPRIADVRVIAATHRRLPELIAAGDFREDLYFRLRGFEFVMPALRERLDDLPLLVAAFWEQAAPGRGGYRLSPEVQTALCARPWPGNVRELRSVIERAAVLARGGPLAVEHLATAATPITSRETTDLPEAVERWVSARLVNAPDDSELLRTFLAVTEPPLISAALQACQGQRAAAARLLGIDRTTLRTKLRAYGLDDPTE